MSKEKHHGHKKDHSQDIQQDQERQQAGIQSEFWQMEGNDGSSNDSCLYIFTCLECDAEQYFPGLDSDEEPLCPECGKRMQAKPAQDKEKLHSEGSPPAYAGEWGGKGGFSGESNSNLFSCPECNADQAFPGMKPDEQPQCPKCAIPMKAKYVETE